MNNRGQIFLESLLLLPLSALLAIGAIVLAQKFYLRSCLELESALLASFALHREAQNRERRSTCLNGAKIERNYQREWLEASIQLGSWHAATRLWR